MKNIATHLDLKFGNFHQKTNEKNDIYKRLPAVNTAKFGNFVIIMHSILS